MIEHREVAQPHPKLGYDPMRPYAKIRGRFKTIVDLD